MRDLFTPFRFKVLPKAYRRQAIDFLDIGCGSHSPRLTKRWAPNCRYHGVDRDNYGNDDEDFRLMERFYRIDLAREPLDPVPDDHFDVVVMSHVIEHLPNGLDVVRAAVRKLKPGGKIYIESPSERSLRLPSMPDTLHFCDDPTHVRVYGVREVANVLLEEGCTVHKAGTRRDRLRIALFPLLVPVKAVLRGRISGGDFWDVAGFAQFVYGARKA